MKASRGYRAEAMHRPDVPTAVVTTLSAKHWGPSASQEFFITLTEPVAEAVTSLANEPALRGALQRNRCRLAFLGASPCRRSADPLASFALCRVRVRLVAPDQAAVRRCLRLLALRFPTFAYSSWDQQQQQQPQQPQPATGPRDDRRRAAGRDRRWGPALVSGHHLLLPPPQLTVQGDRCFLGCRDGLCATPRHPMEMPTGLYKSQHREKWRHPRDNQWTDPNPRSYGRNLADDRGCSHRGSTVFHSLPSLRQHLLLTAGPSEGDSYSAFFTASQDSDLLGRDDASSVSDCSTVSCATLVVAMDGCRRARGSVGQDNGDASLQFERTCRSARPDSGDSRAQKCSRSTKESADKKPGRQRVSNACIQTTPRVLSAGDSFNNSQSVGQLGRQDQLLGHPQKPPPPCSAADQRHLRDSFTSTTYTIPADAAVQIASQQVALLSPAVQPGIAAKQQGSAQGHGDTQPPSSSSSSCRIRGKLAHRRVTWYLRKHPPR